MGLHYFSFGFVDTQIGLQPNLMTKTWDFVDANDKPIKAGEEIQFIIESKIRAILTLNLDYFDTFEDGNGTSLEELVLIIAQQIFQMRDRF